jgi:hypothetical protein
MSKRDYWLNLVHNQPDRPDDRIDLIMDLLGSLYSQRYTWTRSSKDRKDNILSASSSSSNEDSTPTSHDAAFEVDAASDAKNEDGAVVKQPWESAIRAMTGSKNPFDFLTKSMPSLSTSNEGQDLPLMSLRQFWTDWLDVFEDLIQYRGRLHHARLLLISETVVSNGFLRDMANYFVREDYFSVRHAVRALQLWHFYDVNARKVQVPALFQASPLRNTMKH